MARLNISEREIEDATILDLCGDIIFGEGNVLFRSAIRRPLEEGKKKIYLNFANVCFMDSSGVGELVSGYTAISREGGQLKLFSVPRRVYEILAITKLANVFDISENEAEALGTYSKMTI